MVATQIKKPESGCCGQVKQAKTYTPIVDVVENADEVLLIADVPGATSEGIDIQFERGMLTLRANVAPRYDENKAYLYREYGVGNFERSFNVSEHIDANGISAQVKNGVLTVRLPKAEAVKPRKIEVKND